MIYFVTEAYLKQKTPITANVSAVEVTKFVEPAALAWMQSILGTYFFNDLLTKYNAQTLSANEELLVAKMQPAIAWRAAEDAVIALTYQLKNKGIQKQNGDNSESVELQEVGFVMKHYSQKSEHFEFLTRAWLKNNKDLFAAFTSTSNCDSEIKPQTNDNYNSDMLFI